MTSSTDALSPAQVKAAWDEILSTRLSGRVFDTINRWPDTACVVVDIAELFLWDAKLAEQLIATPKMVLAQGKLSLGGRIPHDFKVTLGDTELDVKVRGSIDSMAYRSIQNIKEDALGHLTVVRGLVRRALQPRVRLLEGAFKCMKCLAVVSEPQNFSEYTLPVECYKDQGGCGKARSATIFRLIAPGEKETDASKEGSFNKESQYCNAQKLELQEIPEGLRGGQQPERLAVVAEDELVRIAYPGDRVVITGILMPFTPDKKNDSTVSDWYLSAQFIEREDATREDVIISADDEVKIREFAAEPAPLNTIITAVAPSIYGMSPIKRAIALQLFGGISKHHIDGTNIRGSIHLLLVGDPGIAKSQLLHWVSCVAPRAVAASGKSSSAAGITASAVKDLEGRWTLEAGATVIADGGTCVIDEFDKMNEDDRGALHEVMEQQSLTVNKAGISCVLNARCSILAACNPTDGRFDPNIPLPEQIDLLPSLLSRFDLVFLIEDIPKEDLDRAIAQHIAKSYESVTSTQPSLLTEVELRKWAVLGRRLNPIIPPEVTAKLTEFYVTRRSEVRPGRAIPMVPRQFESLCRLSIANARVRLSNVVSMEDAVVAMGLMNYFLDQPGIDSDIDRIATGKGKRKRDARECEDDDH